MTISVLSFCLLDFHFCSMCGLRKLEQEWPWLIIFLLFHLFQWLPYHLYFLLNVIYQYVECFWAWICCLHIANKLLGLKLNWFILFYVCFCSYLVTVMGLVAPWSFLLALIDAYSVFIRCLPRQQRVVSIIVMGDFVCFTMSLTSLWLFCSFIRW